MEYKVVMPYIGGILTDNSYKFLNKGTKPIVNIWKKDLAEKVASLGIPKVEEYEVRISGKFTDERRPDIPNLFKVILDGLKKTRMYHGLGVDDKHIHPIDAGYELGYIDPVIEITIIPLMDEKESEW
jgi:Holliday junction resolvase RusA-like endonuclease